MRLRILYIVFDHLLLFASLLLIIGLRDQTLADSFKNRQVWLAILFGMHLIIAFSFDKYNFSRRRGLRALMIPIVYTNIALAALVSMAFVLWGQIGIPRMLFFGSLAAFTLIELLFAFFIYIIRAVNSQGFVFESSPRKFMAAAKAASIDVKKPSESRMRHINEKAFVSVKGQHIKKSVVEDYGEDVLGYLERKVPLIGSATVLAVNERINILNIPSENAHTIVNLSLINNHRFVNKFFEAVNIRLDKNGYYCGCCLSPKRCAKKTS
jgi:hypothetical protein